MDETEAIAVTVNDVIFRGTYHVEGRPPVVYVSSEFGTKATQAGGLPPDAVAHRLLAEIVQGYLLGEG